MNRHLKSFVFGLSAILIICLSVGGMAKLDISVAVDGTTGSPLGGFGAGAVKFQAWQGTFAVMTQAPADAYDYVRLNDARFQMYTKRDGKVESVAILQAAMDEGRYLDDAIWPLHLADFPIVNDVAVALTSFSPLDNIDYHNMSLPYAFYEFELTNLADSDAEAALAFQLNFGGPTAYFAENGIASKKWAVTVNSNGTQTLITAGHDQEFLSSGQCNNILGENVNRLAAQIHLAPGEIAVVQFVLAWYDNKDPERFYYLGLYDEPGKIALEGLANFDLLKRNAVDLVTKMRYSNLPVWLQNQTLNTLANLTNNSMYKKDGRVAFAEGQWTCFGTMDQMWHARSIISEFLPFFAWQELNYWARTQKQSGQIHHDFNDYNSGSYQDRAALSTLMGWDDTEHSDYRNIDAWVDLNCALIISVYETFMVTNDQKQLDFLWPYMKKAAQRVLDQVRLYGNPLYPYTFSRSDNSYDAGGDPNPYNASLSAVAYKIMTVVADIMSETETVEKYSQAYETVVQSYRQRYLTDNWPGGRVSESFFAGQWLALHLKLGEIWTAEETDYVLAKLDEYYHPYSWGVGTLKGTYNEWTPYLLTHYGGLLINTGRIEDWYNLQYDAYNRQYSDRNKVFNHPLDILPAVNQPVYPATDIGGGRMYISLPGLWRNYKDIVGFHYNSYTQELWLTPVLLTQMGGQLEDALFITPDGYGTISCTAKQRPESNLAGLDIEIKTEFPLTVSKIYLTDSFGEYVAVTIDGILQNLERVGSGYGKELAVDWNGVINGRGITLAATGDAGTVIPARGEIYPYPADFAVSSIIDGYSAIAATTATEMAGVEIISPVGQDWYLTGINNFDYIKFDNVNFGTVGTKEIEFTLKGYAPGWIEVVLDSVGGRIVDRYAIEVTPTNQGWVNLRFPIEKLTGQHSIVLRFAGNQEETLIELLQFRFLADDGRLDRTLWTATASNNGSYTYAFLDGDVESRWHGSYQEVGKWIVLDMKSDQQFNKITIDNSQSPNDCPRGYEIYIATDAQGSVFTDPVKIGGIPLNSPIGEIVFDTVQTARYIKILLTENDPAHYFSMHELYVWDTTEFE